MVVNRIREPSGDHRTISSYRHGGEGTKRATQAARAISSDSDDDTRGNHGVGVGDGMLVGVAVEGADGVGVGVLVGDSGTVEVGNGVLAGIGVAVELGVLIIVGVGIGDGVFVGTGIAVKVVIAVGLGVLVGTSAPSAPQKQPEAKENANGRNAMRTIYGRRFIASPRLIQGVDRHDVERMNLQASQPAAHSPRNPARTQEAQAPRLRSKPSSLFSMSYRHS